MNKDLSASYVANEIFDMMMQELEGFDLCGSHLETLRYKKDQLIERLRPTVPVDELWVHIKEAPKDRGRQRIMAWGETGNTEDIFYSEALESWMMLLPNVPHLDDDPLDVSVSWRAVDDDYLQYHEAMVYVGPMPKEANK